MNVQHPQISNIFLTGVMTLFDRVIRAHALDTSQKWLQTFDLTMVQAIF